MLFLVIFDSVCLYFLLLELQCPVFQKPKDMIVHPEVCGLVPSKYGTVCRFSCPQGFILAGIREELRCLSSKEWSEDLQKAFCKGMDFDDNFLLLEKKNKNCGRDMYGISYKCETRTNQD